MKNRKNKLAKYSLILKWASGLKEEERQQIHRKLLKKQKLIQKQGRGRRFSVKEPGNSLLTVKDFK